MSNLTILEQNTLLGLEHDDTQELYLRGAQINEHKALFMASAWQDYLRPFLEFIKAQKLYPETAVDEVIEYIKERHYRRYFPNQ